MSDSYYIDIQRDVLINTIPNLVQAYIYGGYVVLFCQCIHIFRKRRLRSRSHKIFLIGTILLFAMCTCQATLYSTPLRIIESSTISDAVALGMALSKNILYLLANLVADFLFIYRCYIIWGSSKYKKYILWAPLSLTVLNTGAGICFAWFSGTFALPPDISAPITLYISLAINVGLCALSAGHIWWISQRLKFLGPQVSQKYNTVIILIIESGAIYCISIVGYLVSLDREVVLSTSYSRGPGYAIASIFSNMFLGIMLQAVGIVPTLIVVRIGLGVSAEDAQTVILASRLQFDRNGEGGNTGRTTDQLGAYNTVRTGGKDEMAEYEEQDESDLQQAGT